MRIFFPKHSLTDLRAANVWYLFEAFFHVALLQMHGNWTTSMMILLSKNTQLPLFSIYH